MDSKGLISKGFAFGPAPSGEGQEGGPAILQLVPIILMLVIFYFLLIRPQQKKAKEHQELLKQLKIGDKVVTSSGIIGVIVSLKDKVVVLRTGDTKLEIQKSAVTEITEKGSNQEEE